jgi:predicted TIM-barrel fold metal-dependent hydrolase
LLREAGPVEVLKLVHVDANHDPADPVEETRWLQGLADNEGTGMPNAIVAGADLSADNAQEVLEGHAAFANTRGIRQILNVHANPLYDYVGRHYMREPQWRKNFALLRRYSMSFDLQLYPSQMKEAAELAQEHPRHAVHRESCGHVRRSQRWRGFVHGVTACVRWLPARMWR